MVGPRRAECAVEVEEHLGERGEGLQEHPQGPGRRGALLRADQVHHAVALLGLLRPRKHRHRQGRTVMAARCLHLRSFCAPEADKVKVKELAGRTGEQGRAGRLHHPQV